VVWDFGGELEALRSGGFRGIYVRALWGLWDLEIQHLEQRVSGSGLWVRGMASERDLWGSEGYRRDLGVIRGIQQWGEGLRQAW